MNRIKSISFKNHPILGNLHLSFCDLSGNPVDTVIIAGENGVGKSAVIDSVYQAVCFNSSNEISIEFAINGKETLFEYYYKDCGNLMFINDHDRINTASVCL